MHLHRESTACNHLRELAQTIEKSMTAFLPESSRTGPDSESVAGNCARANVATGVQILTLDTHTSEIKPRWAPKADELADIVKPA